MRGPGGLEPDRDRRIDDWHPWAYEAVRFSTWIPVRLVFRLRAVGADRVPDRGPTILAPTHRSNWDTLVVGMALRRRMRIMAKAELYRVPGLAQLMRACGVFKVERGRGDRAALEAAQLLLGAGEMLLIYPEGTRNRHGRARAHTGTARLALATGATIVPALVLGTDRVRLLPPRLPRFEVAYGRPLRLDDLAGLDVREAARRATERWNVAVEELRAELAG